MTPERFEQLLATDEGLDEVLGAYRVAAPNGELMRRIAATAFDVRPMWWRRARVWWTGAAVAATAAAGAFTGALVLGPTPQATATDVAYESTVFGDLES